MANWLPTRLNSFLFNPMFPHSDWTIMTQMISLVIAVTQSVVKIDLQLDIGRFLGKVLCFLLLS